jgi:hypothetical protein
MSTWVVQVVIVAVFALACGVLALAWTRGRLGTAALALLAIAVVTWIAAFAAISTEFRGANDFATCDNECSAIHYVSAVAFIAPPLLISLAALAMLVTRGARWRARRADGHENHA